VATRKKTAAQDQGQRTTARRSVLTGGAVGLAAVAGAAIGRPGPASAQNTTPSVTDWINVTQTSPPADNSGATDSTAAINQALSQAHLNNGYNGTTSNVGAVVYMPVGIYKISGPLFVPHGVTLRGATPMNHSADGQTNDWGTVIKPMTTQSPAPAWSAGTNVNGVISFDATNLNALPRVAVENIWIDGSQLSTFSTTPTVDGIAATGGVEALTIRNVGVYSVTGNGIAGYSPGMSKPDGWVIENSVVQSVTGYGISFAGADSHMSNVHVQQCGAGFLITGGNNRLVGCRADQSSSGTIGSGFTIDVRQNGGFSGSTTLIGCGTEENNLYGLSLINSASSPSSSDPVIAMGCSFDGDGVNGGAGGGNYAGVSVQGINTLILNSCNVNVMANPNIMNPNKSAPQHALALSSNAQGEPLLIQALGGLWNCTGTNPIYPAAAPPVQVLSYGVHVFTGGQIGSSGGAQSFEANQL
jgi:hypothetical protein